jgi:hypothetical protein
MVQRLEAYSMTAARILLSCACWWAVFTFALHAVLAWRDALTSTRRTEWRERIRLWLLPPLALLAAAGAVAVWP